MICSLRTAAALVLLLLAVGGDAGCSRGPSTPHPASAAETFKQLRAWHASGAYLAMRPYLDPEARDATIDLLMSTDELLAANQAALASVRQACPDLPAGYDMSCLADNLDLFSRRVELVRVEEQGDKAVVIAKVSDRLPLVRIHFVRLDGNWAYVPGPPNSAVAKAIQRLTESLHQIAVVASTQQHMTPAQVQDEYRTRLLPKLKTMRLLGTSPTSGPG